MRAECRLPMPNERGRFASIVHSSSLAFDEIRGPNTDAGLSSAAPIGPFLIRMLSTDLRYDNLLCQSVILAQRIFRLEEDG